jgi:uncharacterized protein (TIGR02996 family)
MTDREALIAAVAAAPADDLPRLVFADWLEENGDPTQAAFIRGHVALARLPPRAANREKLAEELRAAAVRHAAGWVAPVCAAFGQPPPDWPPAPAAGWLRRLMDWRAAIDFGRPYWSRGYGLAVPCDVRGGKEAAGVPLGLVGFRRGLADWLWVAARYVRDAGGFAAAAGVGPLTELHLVLGDDDPDAWHRAAGEWAGRVRALGLAVGRSAGGRAAAASVFRSPVLSGLRGLSVFAPVAGDDSPFDETPAPGVIHDLARSWLGGRVRVLRLPLVPSVLRELRDFPPRLDELCPGGVGRLTMSPADCRGLADLPFRPNLKRLSLRGCLVTDDALAALGRGPHWDNLLALGLDWNLLTDPGGVALARLAPFPRLQRLRLDHNQLADDAGRALARSPLVRTLRVLDLSHNRLTADGALPLAVALAEGPLRLLKLGGNTITRRRRRRIRDILRGRVALDP